jgi:hypothetical protein
LILVRLIPYVGITLMFLSSCSSRISHRAQLPGPSVAAANDYIDIEADWRLTVVTPITKSGGYVLKSLEQQTSGNSITLSAGADFVGYEVAHYLVKGQRKGRVRIEFSSAQVTKEGTTESQLRPIVPLFQLGYHATYVRLIYLVRVSQADHNMAVVSARQLDALDSLTRLVQANPAVGCTVTPNAACSWIPEGIAVRPEERRIVDGVENWVSAR